MKRREYCCCAIPIINAGIYFALTEQFVLGILVGILSVSTPSIVGAVTPSFARYVFGIVCFVASGVQVLGFIGVAQEKTILFRRYISLHLLAIVAAFSVALAWIILSASRHSTAKANCLSSFFANATSQEESEGETLCSIFPYVEVGVMGGLWVIFAALHVYLYVVLSSYSSTQQRDHIKYDSVQSPASPNENIALNARSGRYDPPYTTFPNENTALDNRTGPYDPPYQQRDMSGGHFRAESATSMSDVMSEPIQQASDAGSVSRETSHLPPALRRPSLSADDGPPTLSVKFESPALVDGQSDDLADHTLVPGHEDWDLLP
ncbi:hypothetical protein DFH07DRAFT_876712 [Mycena maculata]|uniref:Transmembrane protein n=1 Tax=Mycena maculata TaxID=230809 RepID=A0AAD7K3I0_9AGAR|nr:hypothetical protein DFH07DRAFT_876712 [Mycena maculata]